MYDEAEDILINTREAAEILGCTQRWVRYLIKAGELPAQKIGGYNWVLRLEDVEEMKGEVDDEQ